MAKTKSSSKRTSGPKAKHSKVRVGVKVRKTLKA